MAQVQVLKALMQGGGNTGGTGGTSSVNTIFVRLLLVVLTCLLGHSYFTSKDVDWWLDLKRDTFLFCLGLVVGFVLT